MLELTKNPKSGILKTSVPALNPNISKLDAGVIYDSNGFIGGLYKNFVKEEVGEVFYNLKYPKSDRQSGLASTSQIFGYAPRDFIKRHPGRACKFNREFSPAYKLLISLGMKATDYFFKSHPKEFRQHKEAFDKIKPAWQIPGTVFTSGIINSKTKLLYHTDNGNMPGCFSAMFTFKKNIRGGDLHLPDYDLVLENKSGSLLIFDGAAVVHGVTPFIKTSLDAQRITIVFYVLKPLINLAENQQEEVKVFNRLLWESNYAKDKSKK